MPWAMSAPTVASAVVMRAAASTGARSGAGLGVGLGGLASFMLSARTAAECADQRCAVESFDRSAAARRAIEVNLSRQAFDQRSNAWQAEHVPMLGNLLIGASLVALAVMAGSLDSARIAAGPEARLSSPLERAVGGLDWQRSVAPARAGAAVE